MNSDELFIDVPMSIRPLFLAAGWHRGRQVLVPEGIATDHPAAAVLAQFAGLTVGKSGPGEECAAVDVHFCEVEPDAFIADVWSALLDTELVGVAEVHHAHGTLYIDNQGRCFGTGLDHDVFWFEGASFGEAMKRLLLGRPPRPMLRPNQSTVMMFGEEIAASHPSVYRYR
jgi:hypothetical protein